MSKDIKDKRREERQAAKGIFRIYTSVTCCAYTVPLKDISAHGVFIKTDHLPKIDEIITYVVLDRSGVERMVGNARVRWVNDKDYRGDIGFGIELEEALADEILAELAMS